MCQCLQHYSFSALAGNRRIVGFGKNGYVEYEDLEGYPCPAINFKEDVGEIANLREKEKGDWNNLTVAEKKECKGSALS